MKFALKVLVFAAVSFATWIMTSSIVAQQRIKPAAQPRRTTPQALKLEAVDDTMGRLSGTLRKSQPAGDTKTIATPPQVALGRSGAFAEAYLRSRKITVQDGVATVTAHVSIADKRPGMSYVWRLRVLDPQGNPVAGRVYDQQMFTVENNGQKEVDFEDIVDVPVDAKLVELALYAKAPNEDLSLLNDETKARASQLIRAIKVLKP